MAVSKGVLGVLGRRAREKGGIFKWRYQTYDCDG